MPWYSQADAELVKLVQRVMREHHPRLAEVELRVDLLCAHPKTDKLGEPCEDALTVNGYPALATIKIRGPKERAEGRGDVLITIDAYRWDEQTAAENVAILDHELCHIDLATSNSGEVKRDDYDRPKLVRRLHDRQYGWFDAVAKRHPISSQEVQQAKLFVDQFGQIYLPGFAPPAEPKRGKRAKAGRRSQQQATLAD